MKTIDENSLEFVGECFLKDIDVRRRQGNTLNDSSLIDKLQKIFKENAPSIPIVYTAFDGDHFHLLQNMRQYALKHGYFSANPESILGYKNVVTKYQNKRGVLVDDLSILAKCRELWIFTDCNTTLLDFVDLPEGVLVELAYYLKRVVEKPIVKFIPLSLMLRGEEVMCRQFPYSFAQVEERLSNSNRSGVLAIANNNYQIDTELKQFIYYLSDPLDFKYSEWLRERLDHHIKEGIEKNTIALVPGLASRISDAGNSVSRIGRIVLSWASFMQFSEIACQMPSIDTRNPSIVVEALKGYFAEKEDNIVFNKSWISYQIPKSTQGKEWPITQHEADLIAKFNIAIVDIGSARVKTLIEVSNNGISKKIQLKSETHLMSHLNTNGDIDELFINTKFSDELLGLKETLRNHDCKNSVIIGTQVLRIAKNSSKIIEKIEAVLGKVSIISNWVEGVLMYKAIQKSIGLDNIATVDIGGGSVQISSGVEESDIISIPTGTFALEKQFQKDKTKATFEELDAMSTFIRNSLDKGKKREITTLVMGSNCMHDFMSSAMHHSQILTREDSIERLKTSDVEKLFNKIKGVNYDCLSDYYPENSMFMHGADKALLNILEISKFYSSKYIVPTNESVSSAMLCLMKSNPLELISLGITMNEIDY